MRILYFLFLVPIISIAQETLQKGTVYPAIELDAATGENYSMYLPRDYDDSNVYPTVFIFNDEAGTPAIVQQFTIGAELTGSIVVGANYRLSDSLPLAVKETQKLINHVYERYAVDDKKIILAGKGNGALVASAGAQLVSSIYGVMTVGNTYVDKKLLKTKNTIKFVLYSPDEGGNFYTMRGYGELLDDSDQLVGFYEFDGGNEWPEAGYLSAGLVDILQSDDDSEALSQKFYESDLAFGDLLYKRQDHLYALEFVTNLRKQYRKKVDLDGQKELLKKIKSSNKFRIDQIAERLARNEEGYLAEDIAYYLEEDANNAYFDNLGWWNFQMEELQVKIDSAATGVQERKSALRLRGYTRNAVERQYAILKAIEASPEKLLFINILRTLVDPKNQNAFLNTIALSAREGDTNAALFYLEELLKTGYADLESLYTLEYTSALRISEQWNLIIKDYLGASKYF